MPTIFFWVVSHLTRPSILLLSGDIYQDGLCLDVIAQFFQMLIFIVSWVFDVVLQDAAVYAFPRNFIVW